MVLTNWVADEILRGKFETYDLEDKYNYFNWIDTALISLVSAVKRRTMGRLLGAYLDNGQI